MQFNIDNNSNKSQKMFTASLVIGSLVVELYIHVLYLCYGSQLTFELQVVTKVSRRLCSTCINGNSRYKSLQCTVTKVLTSLFATITVSQAFLPLNFLMFQASQLAIFFLFISFSIYCFCRLSSLGPRTLLW